MYNLHNLNDSEFELLCKDILELKLETNLHTFPKGRDGGIDICDSKKNPEIIIQVKHYINSKYTSLIAELRKEVEKVKKHNPKAYYVCSGLSLTKKNKNEIYNLFSDYMKDLSHIIDSTEINSFLSQEANKDIVKKHYKLWLCASNVLTLINNQNVFIDCEVLMDEIETDRLLFVPTQAYSQAKQILNKYGIIIITGDPGVGKSILSKMLVLFYANENYTVRYTTDSNISDIKKAISINPKDKEVILLDDFLGQHYLNIKQSQPNQLKALLSYVLKNPNKKIILNSRITILNQAKQTHLIFEDMMDKYEFNTYLIDLNKMLNLEKAKILYNHIYFNELPKEYFINIKLNSSYMRIIKHKNYNPRIIEYVTKRKNYNKISPDCYFSYIQDMLDKPEAVWHDGIRIA